jgi:predicted nucleic acid-binding protein
MSSRWSAAIARSTNRLTRYCLDANFVLGPLVLSATTPAVVARWSRVTPSDDLLAPHLLFTECTSILTEQVHRKRLEEADARAAIEFIIRSPIRLIHANSLFTRSFEIARFAGCSKAYDALYLATAEHEGAELLTLDRGMRHAASRLGIRATLVR